jgi:hypothetical protein
VAVAAGAASEAYCRLGTMVALWLGCGSSYPICPGCTAVQGKLIPWAQGAGTEPDQMRATLLAAHEGGLTDEGEGGLTDEGGLTGSTRGRTY